MCVGKGGAHGGKTINVRSPGLRVSAQVTDPVVQVVDCNEENIRTVISCEGKGGEKDCNKGKKAKGHNGLYWVSEDCALVSFTESNHL